VLPTRSTLFLRGGEDLFYKKGEKGPLMGRDSPHTVFGNQRSRGGSVTIKTPSHPDRVWRVPGGGLEKKWLEVGSLSRKTQTERLVHWGRTKNKGNEKGGSRRRLWGSAGCMFKRKSEQGPQGRITKGKEQTNSRGSGNGTLR